MKKRPLLDVLLEVQEKLPNSHLHGDRKRTIALVIKELRQDLGSGAWPAANVEALRGPHYWTKEDHDHLNPMMGIWNDEWTQEFPMLLFEEPWISRPGLGRRLRRRR